MVEEMCGEIRISADILEGTKNRLERYDLADDLEDVVQSILVNTQGQK
jgi:hypothetical protein